MTATSYDGPAAGSDGGGRCICSAVRRVISSRSRLWLYWLSDLPDFFGVISTLRKTAFVSGLEVGYGRPDAAQGTGFARLRSTQPDDAPRFETAQRGIERRGRHARLRAAALPGDRDTTFSADQLARDIDEFLSIPHAIQDALLSALQQL